ncbi:hypothetical protein AWC15_20030 [Mycobacterium lacus]|nr:hypothetical protein AWC15_20030 [Mycobacterium lacus]
MCNPRGFWHVIKIEPMPDIVDDTETTAPEIDSLQPPGYHHIGCGDVGGGRLPDLGTQLRRGNRDGLSTTSGQLHRGRRTQQGGDDLPRALRDQVRHPGWADVGCDAVDDLPKSRIDLSGRRQVEIQFVNRSARELQSGAAGRKTNQSHRSDGGNRLGRATRARTC